MNKIIGDWQAARWRSLRKAFWTNIQRFPWCIFRSAKLPMCVLQDAPRPGGSLRSAKSCGCLNGHGELAFSSRLDKYRKYLDAHRMQAVCSRGTVLQCFDVFSSSPKNFLKDQESRRCSDSFGWLYPLSICTCIFACLKAFQSFSKLLKLAASTKCCESSQVGQICDHSVALFVQTGCSE